MSRRGASRNDSGIERSEALSEGHSFPDGRHYRADPHAHKTRASQPQIRVMDGIRSSIKPHRSPQENIRSVALLAKDNIPLMNSVLLTDTLHIIEGLALPQHEKANLLSNDCMSAVASVVNAFASERILKDAGNRELVNTLFAIGRIFQENPQLDRHLGDSIRKIANETKHHTPNMSDRDLAIFAKAAVALKLDPVKYVSLIEREAFKRIDQMDGEQISDIAHMHGLVGSNDAYLAYPIAKAFERAIKNHEPWAPRENIRVAFTLSCIFVSLKSPEKLQELTEREQADLVPFLKEWPGIADSVIAVILKDLDQMHLNYLAMTAKTLRLLKGNSSEFAKAIDERAAKIAREMQTFSAYEISGAVRNLVSIAASINAINGPEPECLNPLIRFVRNFPKYVEPMGAVKIADLLSQVDDRDPELFHLLASLILPTVSSMTPKRLVMTMAAYEHKNVCAPLLFEALERRFHSSIREFTGYQLSHFVSGLAGMGAMHGETCRVIISELERRMRIGLMSTLEGYAGTIHGLAIQPDSDFAKVWALVNSVGKFEELSELSISLIYRAGFGRYQDISQSMQHYFDLQTLPVSPPTSSRFEESVLDPLNALAEKHQLKIVREMQILDRSADFGLIGADKKYVLELDGCTYHNIGGTWRGDRRPKDILRDAIAARSGFEVICITDYEWGNVKFEDQMNYLEEKIFRSSNGEVSGTYSPDVQEDSESPAPS